MRVLLLKLNAMYKNKLTIKTILAWATFCMALICATSSIIIHGQWPRHSLIALSILTILLSFKDIKITEEFKQYIYPWFPWLLGLIILCFYHGMDGFSRYFNAIGLVVLLFFSLQQISISLSLLLSSLCLISLIFSSFICFDVISQGGVQTNILGVNKNILIPLNTLCNVSCLIGLLTHFQSLKKITIYLLLISLLLAIITLVLTECRTALLAYLALFPIVFFQLKNFNKKFLLLFFALLILLVAMFFFTGRVQDGIDDLLQLSSGNANSSLGIRFTLWRIALDGFQTAPFFGIGPHFTLSDLSGDIPHYVRGILHLHSDYFQFLAIGGLIGLISWLLTCLYLVFWSKGNPCCQAIILASLAMGLTEKYWNYWASLVEISILIALFYQTNRKKNKV